MTGRCGCKIVVTTGQRADRNEVVVKEFALSRNGWADAEDKTEDTAFYKGGAYATLFCGNKKDGISLYACRKDGYGAKCGVESRRYDYDPQQEINDPLAGMRRRKKRARR